MGTDNSAIKFVKKTEYVPVEHNVIVISKELYEQLKNALLQHQDLGEHIRKYGLNSLRLMVNLGWAIDIEVEENE